MKGFRIAINILLVINLIISILCIILIPTVIFPSMIDSLNESTETTNDFGEAMGNIFAVGFAALFLILFCGLLMIVCIFAALAIIPFIIIYNVSKYPKLGIGIVVLIFISLPAGILMLIQRSKYLKQSVEEQTSEKPQQIAE